MENKNESLLITNAESFQTGGGFRGNKLAILLLIVGILIGGFWLVMSQKSAVTEEATDDESINVVLSGVLLFTAATDGPSEIYSLKIGEEEPIKKFPVFPTTAFPEFTNQFNPTKVFFNAATIYSKAEPDEAGLHSWDISTSTFTYYAGAAGNTERDLNWSEAADKLAFYRLKESVEDEKENPAIDDFEIVIMDTEENIVTGVIEGGVYPRWSPTGEYIFYLRADGLYVHNVAQNLSSKVISPNEAVLLTPSEMLDVSQDGSHLAITSQGTGRVSVFAIESWDPMLLREVYTFADEGKFYTSPVFSPDGTMFAVLTTDKEGESFINPRIEIQTIFNADIVYTYPLNSFDPQKFFIDDWIAKSIKLSE